MLQKIIYIIFILSTFTLYSYGAHISEHNETNLILSINSQLSELRTDTQFIRAKIEQQKNCVLDKETNKQTSKADIQVFRTDVQSLRAELENQKKDILEKEAAIQSLRADIQVFRTEIQSLRAELELQKKYILEKEAENKIPRAEEKLKIGLVKDLNQWNSSSSLHNCVEAKSSGIYNIVIPNFSNQSFKAACDAETREGGWTIILRRMDGSVNFYRNWTEYKNGFGNLDGEYFLGLDIIHAMTAERPQELLVLLEDFEGDERFETYDEFAIGDESQQYKLHTLSNGNGTAGDSLFWHRNMKFTTFDKDNDYDWNDNCAIDYTGAWWHEGFYICHASQLTGTYKDNSWMKGVNWKSFRGFKYSLKTAVMMIRPKK